MNSFPPDGAAVPFDFPGANFPRRTYSGDNMYTSHNNMNSNILYIAIISLSLVLVLVFALHLYARFILRRQARRRAAIHHLTLAVSRYSSADPPSTSGLHPAVISSLPTFIFSKNKNSGAGGISGTGETYSSSCALECSVCLSNMEEGEEVRLLPNCKHVFHVACVDRWLAAQSTCPVCRTGARPVMEPRPREGPTGEGSNNKSGGSVSRLSSFRRILSRERSSRRIQPSTSSSNACDDCVDRDLERQ